MIATIYGVPKRCHMFQPQFFCLAFDRPFATLEEMQLHCESYLHPWSKIEDREYAVVIAITEDGETHAFTQMLTPSTSKPPPSCSLTS